ncbi:Uncharacterized conserved protein [Plasmopara halstedii]|uniref:Uncharacterized conserved protein n=1 Tax=Plasmopara halstedii TaxID=4781 RepID=A0A0N7L5H5_PLAHL|nr:Uncharacterized conserved protein [Plasmopara halstedii]CEG41491.1 Uncharacterized conserved protein [Plasmopara halstedii]|eukprot:XP_024577860.1 Uncharacterized conserved protein [Plasmopara halstedii]
MDRENTPQKQRQKRSSSNRRVNTGFTAHDALSRAGTNSASGPNRAFRTRNRTAAPTGPAAASGQPRTPSMLLRPNSNGASGLTGVLYEPDASRRSRSVVDRDIHLQTNTRSNTIDRHGSKASLNGITRPSTPSRIVPPYSIVKLITPQMQFSTDLSVKLGNCLELENFKVIGVFGLEGVGKSTILSLLLPEKMKEMNLFPIRSFEAAVMDRHETTGVDLAISMIGGKGHSLILLDSQPLLSSSMLVDLLERNESQKFGALNPEQQVEVASYQLAVFLSAICHYVVFVHDDLAYQVSARDLLRNIERKLMQCRLPSVSGNNHRHAAQLLYIANNMTESDLLYRENELFSAHERALESVWSHALVRVPYKLSTYSDVVDDDKNALHVASFVFPHQTNARAASAVLTTEQKTKNDHETTNLSFDTNKYSNFDEIAEDFQRFVLGLPSSPAFTSQSAISPESKAQPRHALSLREWLSNASRVFEALRKASCFTAEFTSSRDYI